MIDLSIIRNAISNMVANGIAFFPRLITGIVVLGMGWILARIIAAVVRRLAERIGFNKIIERTGVSEGLIKAEIKRPASELVALLIFWTIFLNFLLIGLESMGLDAAVLPLRNLIGYLPRFLAAMSTLVAGILLAQFLGRSTQAAMASMGIEFHQQLGQGVNALLMVMVVIVVLQQLGVDATILINIFTNVVSLVVAGLALAFGLGGRDVSRNVLAGFYAREQFSLGDVLEIDGVEGELTGIGTLNAEIVTPNGRLIIPNVRLTETAVQIKSDPEPLNKPENRP